MNEQQQAVIRTAPAEVRDTAAQTSLAIAQSQVAHHAPASVSTDEHPEHSLRSHLAAFEAGNGASSEQEPSTGVWHQVHCIQFRIPAQLKYRRKRRSDEGSARAGHG